MYNSEYHLPKERTSDLYVLRLILFLLEVRLIRGVVKSDGTWLWELGDERMSRSAMERGA